MKLTPTEAFRKALWKLPPNRQRKVVRTLEKFLTAPRLPSLDYRPLRGAPDHFIIDATGGDRIILRKVDDDEFDVVDVGTHDIYRRLNR